MSVNLRRTKTTVGIVRAGLTGSPKLTVVITPLEWGLSFTYQRTDGFPEQVGLSIGPVSVDVYFVPSKPKFYCDKDLVTFTSITKKEAEDGR